MAQATARSPKLRRLERRNRMVGVLRLAIPLYGVVVLAGLAVQLVISNIGDRFGIGQVSISPDAITIDAPDYSGVMEDGSAYRVWAASARAPLDRTDILDLEGAIIVVHRPDGSTLRAEAAESQVDLANNVVHAPERLDFSYAPGTSGVLMDAIADLKAQTLVARGRTEVDYIDGTTIRAEGMTYDAAAARWTFSRAVVTLPATPGEDTP